jgi:hypothetical protein
VVTVELWPLALLVKWQDGNGADVAVAKADDDPDDEDEDDHA